MDFLGLDSNAPTLTTAFLNIRTLISGSGQLKRRSIFFIQNRISNKITQTLSNGVLENYIPFVKGGGFGVTGTIRPAPDDTNGCRTEFVFKSAELDLGRWGVYEFPPIGEGWFDTIYLDNDLRIDSNSRNDILICSTKK